MGFYPKPSSYVANNPLDYATLQTNLWSVIRLASKRVENSLASTVTLQRLFVGRYEACFNFFIPTAGALPVIFS
jgi:hypothetical protein